MAAGGTTTVRRGSYGIDAPYLLVVPIVLIVWNVVDGLLHWRILPFVVTTALLASVGCGLYTSRRGKFVVWASLLDSLALRGDERILDLGCGRGAVLLMAAEHLTTGRAVDIDLGEPAINPETARRPRAKTQQRKGSWSASGCTRETSGLSPSRITASTWCCRTLPFTTSRRPIATQSSMKRFAFCGRVG